MSQGLHIGKIAIGLRPSSGHASPKNDMSRDIAAGRAKVGCQPCRTSHAKCDQASPTCGRCRVAGRECFKSYSWRHHHHARFRRDQKWIRTPKDLTIVDETDSLSKVGDYDAERESADGISSNVSPRPQRPNANLQLQVGLSSPRNGKGGPSPSQQDLNAAALLTEIRSNQAPTAGDNRMKLGGTPLWPLKSESEAILLRHYTQNLAIWLDLCDPKRHFETYVPQRAGSCQVLLNAIFALSARHLSRVGNYDPYASERYHQECLKSLIPMMNDSANVMDEDLFAATIILRVLEEMDVATVGEDTLGYMLGIQVFVSASRPHTTPGGLSEAAFWVGLRQEIYSALMTRQPIRLSLTLCRAAPSAAAADDYGWANRAVVLCADVINLCFSDNGVSLTAWAALRGDADTWEAEKPGSFRPIYYKDAEPLAGRAFPEIWYQHTCHIIGVQHHILAQLLLALFDPTAPKVGHRRRNALVDMKKYVAQRLRDLCGIGLHNRWMPPGMFTASMGIAICGDRLNEKIDQDALLDILVKTEKDHARPTAAVQRQLMKAWGWVD